MEDPGLMAKILIVDDEVNVRKLYSEALKDEGYDTVGGLVLAEFGRVPEHGEQVLLAERFRFRVTEADSRRIVMLEMRDLDAE